MKDLLKEAIADAKTVRETALANAKLALEEAFTPRLQSIISSQLQEEDDMEDDVDPSSYDEDDEEEDDIDDDADYEYRDDSEDDE